MPSKSHPLATQKPSSLLPSASWAPTIALSWLWGLGFFYAIHVTLTYGWIGFLAFAIPNAVGLFLFGWVLGAPGRDPGRILRSVEGAYTGLFLLAQLFAVAITVFGFIAYFWLPVVGEHAGIGVGLLVLAGCATGHAVSLRRLKVVHAAYLIIGVLAAFVAISGLSGTAGAASQAASPEGFDVRFYGLVLPSIVGFLLGPWGDVQHWQRAVEIHREGGSVRVAYGLGAPLFFALLAVNACLATAAGGGWTTVAADGVPGAQAGVGLAVAQSGLGYVAIAFGVWVLIACLSTIDSFYCATRWLMTSVTGKSSSALLAIIPASLVASPLWVLIAAIGLAAAVQAAQLSLMYLMLPFATILVGATACLVCETLGAPRRYDAVLCMLIGLAAALIFLTGYVEPNALARAGAPLIALIGAFPAIMALTRPESAAELPQVVPVAETLAAAKVAIVTAANEDASASYGFDGQWFVLHMIPTYDDTNSVGNVYFANYVRWVGKARELFFNICMPEFDLKTTKYYILTRSFQHEFRREAAEFEEVTIRIKIAKHNRKFVTLAHEIHSVNHGMLGRGEQSLMFVDVTTYHPLDIPRAIVQGFMRYWPKESPHAADKIAAGSKLPQAVNS